MFVIHKDNENMETELSDIKITLRDEKKSRRKLEKIISDCADSLEIALTVSIIKMICNVIY